MVNKYKKIMIASGKVGQNAGAMNIGCCCQFRPSDYKIKSL